MTGKDILEELRLVFKGKSLDTIAPPIIFVLLHRFFDLNIALIGALIIGILLFFLRIYKKESYTYSLGGIAGILLASLLAYIAQNANNYFLPGIIGNALIVVLGLISLLFRRPLAAYASHLTRNWPLDWFWRKDIYPAYKEVTIFWIIFFLMRTVLESYLYVNATPEILAWAEIVLGIPITILILVCSYIYGIWRLKTLNGPGVDEFIDGKEPPFEGQKKGF